MESVWDRTGVDEINPHLYAFMVCFWTTIGVGISSVASIISGQLTFSAWWQVLLFAVICMAFAFGGLAITAASDDPFISFIGFMLVAGSMGFLAGPAFAAYDPAIVAKAFFVTGMMSIVLGFVGLIYPASLESLGGFLFGALALLIIGMIVLPLLGLSMTLLHWVAVIVFSAYIVFDMNRAMRLPHTHDNAIDSAAAIYLDILNLVLHVLPLLANSSDD